MVTPALMCLHCGHIETKRSSRLQVCRGCGCCDFVPYVAPWHPVQPRSTPKAVPACSVQGVFDFLDLNLGMG